MPLDMKSVYEPNWPSNTVHRRGIWHGEEQPEARNRWLLNMLAVEFALSVPCALSWCPRTSVRSKVHAMIGIGTADGQGPLWSVSSGKPRGSHPLRRPKANTSSLVDTRQVRPGRGAVPRLLVRCRALKQSGFAQFLDGLQ